jgi:8-oxo-dGTP diphosphatase
MDAQMALDKPFRLTVRAVIYDKDARVLLLKRSMKSMNYPGKWEFPGGKMDEGERFDDALVREVKEETGLDGRIKRFIGAAKAEMPYVTAIQIVMEVEAPGMPVISHEHEGMAWKSPKDMLSMDLVDWALPFVRDHLFDNG